MIINFKIKYFSLGIGDWGLGIGDWGLGPIPNPQSPIPNPQSPFKRIIFSSILLININLVLKFFKNSNKFKFMDTIENNIEISDNINHRNSLLKYI